MEGPPVESARDERLGDGVMRARGEQPADDQQEVMDERGSTEAERELGQD